MKAILFILLLLVSQTIVSQTIVTGIVLNKNNEPLSNVTVKTSYGNTQTKTGDDGRFSIKIPSNCSELEFTSKDYKWEKVAVTNNEMTVTLLSYNDLDIFELTLEELINVEVAITNVSNSTKIDESPGIVSVITEDEIKNSGARDFIDILNMVPGFSIGLDVQNQTGTIYRGLFAFESRMLFLIDGQMLNEIAYGLISFGNHIPLENIKRIEIIRGPGSAIYGGYAELTVINVITKSGKDINGISVGTTDGATDKTFPFRKNGYINAGTKIKDFEVSFFGRYSESYRSDHDFTDFNQNSFNLRENELNSMNSNFSIKYKNLEIRNLYDNYLPKQRDLYFENLNNAYTLSNLTNNSEIKNVFKINDKLNITAKLNYIYQNPWKQEAPEAGDLEYYMETKKKMYRFSGNVISYYKINNNIDLAIGLENYYDYAINIKGIGFWKGDTIGYNNSAVFLQSNLNNKYFNTTLGMRYDRHDTYGDAFVPRLAIMKKINNLNIKLLYNSAFRAPSIRNIDGNFTANKDIDKPEIHPEKTDVYNLEFSYQINKNIYITSNLFKNQIYDAIVYFVTDLGEDAYDNFGTIGTQGIEAQIKVIFSKLMLNLNYSYYIASENNEIEHYSVPNKNILLGAAQNKFYSSLTYKINKNVHLNTSLLIYGTRYGYDYDKVLETVDIRKFNPNYLLDINLVYNNFLLKGINLCLSAKNILNSEFVYVQTYNGYHAPMNGLDREYLISLNYNIKFNKIK